MVGLAAQVKATTIQKNMNTLTKNRSKEFIVGEFSAAPIEFMFEKRQSHREKGDS